jgi:hypothetical protein
MSEIEGRTIMNLQPQHDQFQTGPNWPQIKSDFEAGVISVREIARREQVSDTAINKRATAEGWDTSLRRPANLPLTGPQTAPQAKTPTPGPKEVEEIVQRALATAAKPLPADGFDWSAKNPDLVAPGQMAVAAYLNPYGQVCIRQECGPLEEDDPYILVGRSDIRALIRRLEELSREAE